MRYNDEGAFYSVTVERNEVDNFRQMWPASGLLYRDITFTFDKRNGDLVDISPITSEASGAALQALSEDAQEWAESLE